MVYESMLTSVITARDKWLKPVSFWRFTLGTFMYIKKILYLSQSVCLPAFQSLLQMWTRFPEILGWLGFETRNSRLDFRDLLLCVFIILMCELVAVLLKTAQK